MFQRLFGKKKKHRPMVQVKEKDWSGECRPA